MLDCAGEEKYTVQMADVTNGKIPSATNGLTNGHANGHANGTKGSVTLV